MSTPRAPEPARLVTGALMADKALFPEVLGELQEAFGPVEMLSPWWEFGYTNYYEREMGAPLFRRMVSFRPLVGQGDLARAKLATNAIEARHEEDGARRVNLDPGILVPSRFVLATGKNFAHRVYLSDGIYADLTLVYRDGGYQTLEWTYPDYAGEEIRGFLTRVRLRFLAARRLAAAAGQAAPGAANKGTEPQ